MAVILVRAVSCLFSFAFKIEYLHVVTKVLWLTQTHPLTPNSPLPLSLHISFPLPPLPISLPPWACMEVSRGYISESFLFSWNPFTSE